MRERILRGWTPQRVLYVVIGAILMLQSWQDRQWSWFAFGLYFCSMGVFAFGCAGGACSTSQCAPVPSDQRSQENVSI